MLQGELDGSHKTVLIILGREGMTFLIAAACVSAEIKF